MTIDFLLMRGFRIIQHEFIKKIYSEFPEGLRGKHRNTAAPKGMFKADPDVLLIHMTAKRRMFYIRPLPSAFE